MYIHIIQERCNNSKSRKIHIVDAGRRLEINLFGCIASVICYLGGSKMLVKYLDRTCTGVAIYKVVSDRFFDPILNNIFT